MAFARSFVRSFVRLFVRGGSEHVSTRIYLRDLTMRVHELEVIDESILIASSVTSDLNFFQSVQNAAFYTTRCGIAPLLSMR